jgi:uncharacterized membrane protein
MAQTEEINDDETEGISVSDRVFWILVFGFCLIFVGFAVVVLSALLSNGSVSVGGVILIGPIPIVFGAGPDAGWLILVGAVITVLCVGAFLVLKRSRKING